MKTNMIVEQSGFYEAISIATERSDIDITSVEQIGDTAGFVETNYGSFYCESFERKDGRVYMKVQNIQ